MAKTNRKKSVVPPINSLSTKENSAKDPGWTLPVGYSRGFSNGTDQRMISNLTDAIWPAAGEQLPVLPKWLKLGINVTNKLIFYFISGLILRKRGQLIFAQVELS